VPHFILTTGSASLFGVVIAFYFYFAPSILAFLRAHRRFWVIAGLNLVSGPLQIALCEYFGLFLKPGMSTAEFTGLALLMLLGPGWLALTALALAPVAAPDPRLQAWRATKTWDMAAALPLMIWFLNNALTAWPNLRFLWRLIQAGDSVLLMKLQLASQLLSIVFGLACAWALLIRDLPVQRAAGVLPRLVALGGTFLGASMLRLTMPEMPLLQQAVVFVLTGLGAGAGAVVLWWLGKSFAIMPEARTLVTSGPYKYVRHPFYAAEIVIVLGMILQYQLPWSLLLGAVVIALQVARSVYEERILSEAFPEYAAYKARTKRFIPGML
jgi:protein-S-isoprenylcysteine O-methyltransferase Ste14